MKCVRPSRKPLWRTDEQFVVNQNNSRFRTYVIKQYFFYSRFAKSTTEVKPYIFCCTFHIETKNIILEHREHFVLAMRGQAKLGNRSF
jgi:hypothetical protein